MRRRATTMMVAVLLAALAGCSDPLADKLESSGVQPYSDEDPSSEEAEDEPDEGEAFLLEVNRVCFTELAKIDGRSFTTPEVYAEWGTVYRAALDAIVFTVGSLGAPPGDEEDVAAIMQGLGEMSAYIASVTTPQGPTMDFTTASMHFSALEGNMRSYGLLSCDLP